MTTYDLETRHGEPAGVGVSCQARLSIDLRLERQIDDANVLLDWGIASGKKLEKDLVARINSGYELLVHSTASAQERSEFESAYNQLAVALAPVTAVTLRATSDEHGQRRLLAPIDFFQGKPVSRARIWSRTLWVWTLGLLFLILMGEGLTDYLKIIAPAGSQSAQTGASPWEGVAFWLARIVPFLYGALGACAYLLRSCHRFIHERTFDPLRIPEYYSQGLLGFLAGGTVILFMKPGGGLIGGETPISAVALAFLAGYSTDFLYTTLERIANAVMPKNVNKERG